MFSKKKCILALNLDIHKDHEKFSIGNVGDPTASCTVIDTCEISMLDEHHHQWLKTESWEAGKT